MDWKFTYTAYFFKTTLVVMCILFVTLCRATGGQQIQTIEVLKKANKVTISWSVTTIKPDAYFEIERAGQDKVFKTAGILFPTENALNKVEFSFKDELKHIGSSGVIYYRIKQVNSNGTSVYSLIKAIELKNSNAAKTNKEVVYNNVQSFSYRAKKYTSPNSDVTMMAGILMLCDFAHCI